MSTTVKPIDSVRKTQLEHNEALKFWRQALLDYRDVNGMRFERPRNVAATGEPTQNSGLYHTYTDYLNGEITQRLMALAQTHDCSLPLLLRCVFAVFLGRWCNEERTVFASNISDNPDHLEPLPVVCQFDGNESFNAFLQRAIKNEPLFSKYSVSAHTLAQSLNQEPLFQALFAFSSVRSTTAPTTNHELALTFKEAYKPYPLQLNVTECISCDAQAKQGVSLHWQYSQDCGESETVSYLANAFNTLLTDIAYFPDKAIFELDIVSGYHQHLLSSIRDTSIALSAPERELTLHKQLQHFIGQQPHTIALTYAGNHFTYKQLGEQLGILLTSQDPTPLSPDPSNPDISGLEPLQTLIQKLRQYLQPNQTMPTSEQDHELWQQLAWMAEEYPIEAGTVLGVCDGSDLFGVLYGLMNGCQVVCLPHSGLEPELFTRWMADNRITHLLLPESALASLTTYLLKSAHMPESSIPEASTSDKKVSETLACVMVQVCVNATSQNRAEDDKEHGNSQRITTTDFMQALPSTRLVYLYKLAGQVEHVSYWEPTQQRYNEQMAYFTCDGPTRYFAAPSLELNQAEDLHFAAPQKDDLNSVKMRFANADLPLQSQDLGTYLTALDQQILPDTVNVAAKTYIGHMTSALPSFMPEFSRLISQLNQNVVKVETSLSLTFIERQVLAMMHKLFFALPSEFYQDHTQDPAHVFGVVTGGGSVSNLTALWCARNRALQNRGASGALLQEQGANGAQRELGLSDGVIIGSRLMHYSMRKIASLFGIGENNILYATQQQSQKVSASDLEQTIAQVNASGRYVIAIVGIAGATETGTIDPLPDMAAVAKKHDIHFHVDGAWGGAVQFSANYRHRIRGVELADSITLCSHKQLYLPQGMSVCLFRNTDSAKSIAVHANYQAMSGSFDLGQYSIEGSRPANALLLHASLHLLSRIGYARLIEQGIEKTQLFVKLMKQYDCFELIGLPELNIVNYRYVPAHLRATKHGKFDDQANQAIDALNIAIQQQQFRNGQSFVSKTRIAHQAHSDSPMWVFRVVISNPLTREQDLHKVLLDQIAIAEPLVKALRGTDNSSNIHETQYAAPDTGSSGYLTTDHAKQEWFIGKPMPGSHVRLLDSYQRSLPVGAFGELFVGNLTHPKATGLQARWLGDGTLSVSEDAVCTEGENS